MWWYIVFAFVFDGSKLTFLSFKSCCIIFYSTNSFTILIGMNEGFSICSGGAGTILHLACALDSVFGLAILLVMGVDVSTCHTALQWLLIHEFVCNYSHNCLLFCSSWVWFILKNWNVAILNIVKMMSFYLTIMTQLETTILWWFYNSFFSFLFLQMNWKIFTIK